MFVVLLHFPVSCFLCLVLLSDCVLFYANFSCELNATKFEGEDKGQEKRQQPRLLAQRVHGSIRRELYVVPCVILKLNSIKFLFFLHNVNSPETNYEVSASNNNSIQFNSFIYVLANSK
jgi:hypothetical protein